MVPSSVVNLIQYIFFNISFSERRYVFVSGRYLGGAGTVKTSPVFIPPPQFRQNTLLHLLPETGGAAFPLLCAYPLPADHAAGILVTVFPFTVGTNPAGFIELERIQEFAPASIGVPVEVPDRLVNLSPDHCIS